MVMGREWRYLDTKRKEFEDGHEWVIRHCQPKNGMIDPVALARAWGASDQAYKDYQQAYHAFFHSIDRPKRSA